MTKQPIRVWLPTLRAGSGSDVFAQRLADGLARAGHDPRLQWFDHDREWRPWTLRSEAAPSGVDVVHAGSWQGFAFKRAGVPLVITEHQYIQHPEFTPHRGRLQSLYHHFFVRRCVLQSYRAADALVAVSAHTAGAMRPNAGRPVQMIHNWVDTERFAPQERMSASSDGVFRLLFVGNPSRWKGADVLPELMGRLGPNFEIQCLGGLRRSFKSNQLVPGMVLRDPVKAEEMPSVYHSVDAVLVPTRYEAFGYVAVEAMACGLPVLGFASTGTAEVCVHGETALLAPMDDVEMLARYARQLSNDAALRGRLGAAGRQRALAYFSEHKAINAYTSLYEELIEQRRAHG
ncbi:glycosyltransferase family 4 protein [Dyella telluris]|uniref:Glycosyltransferase family 4 protein n=1 Tax=Dyella telluris TaxID=2763498 RepID=A0A7G8Q0R5_9GAMM|nr:glycosyltransferase family 4 protein [Dyella telluris]QNK00373.1 glycosyltransferase family 4 protein [Dyella telluris]